MSRSPSQEGHFGLYKRSNGIWYYYVYDNRGIRHQYTTGQKTKAKAQDHVARLLKDGDIIHNEKTNRHSFQAFAGSFYDYEKSPYIADRLARGYKYSQKLARTNQSAVDRHIVPYFKNERVETITPAKVKRWLLDLPRLENISNKTANNSLTLLRQIMDEAKAQGYIRENPAREVDFLCRVDDRTKRRVGFTQSQVVQLFAEPWENRQAMIMCILAASTGMRYGEIRALRREQIREDFIYVDASFSDSDGRKCTKSGWGRIVPIDRKLRDLVLSVCYTDGYVFSYDGEHPVGKHYCMRPLDQRMKELGIQAEDGQLLSFHSFRHYFNTRLVAQGINGDKIRAVIGHEDESMTEHYAHLEVSDFDEVKQVQRRALGMFVS